MKFRLEALRDLKSLIRELALGLRNLRFEDNFSSFQAEVIISATSTATVRNQLKVKPTKYIILDQTGNGLITRPSGTDWTIDNLYLYNNGAVEVTATILFLA